MKRPDGSFKVHLPDGLSLRLRVEDKPKPKAKPLAPPPPPRKVAPATSIGVRLWQLFLLGLLIALLTFLLGAHGGHYEEAWVIVSTGFGFWGFAFFVERFAK